MNANHSLKPSVMSTDTLLGLGASTKRGSERPPSADDGKQQSFKAHLDRKDSERQADAMRADNRASTNAREDRAKDARAESVAARDAASEAKADKATAAKTDAASDTAVATDAATADATGDSDASSEGVSVAGEQGSVDDESVVEEELAVISDSVPTPMVDDPLLSLRPGVLAAWHPGAMGLTNTATELSQGNSLPSTAAGVAASGAAPAAVGLVGAQTVRVSEAQLPGQSGAGELADGTGSGKSTDTLLKTEAPAPAVTTQFALNSAKTVPTAELTLAAQGAAAVVDKLAATTAGLTDKGEALIDVKSASSSRALAPALARYQLEGQPSLTQTRVQVPVGQAQWPTAIAERVLWMAAQRATSAEIHLDPPELGPLQVRVSLSQDAASVSFTSQHAAVREALDLGSFRLREMFESQGLNLVNVDVSDQSLSRQTGDGSGQGKGGTGTGGEGEAVEAVVTKISSHDGLVDHYV